MTDMQSDAVPPVASPVVNQDPLIAVQLAAEASLMHYGTVELVETFGHYEAEYAVIRKGAGVFDAPQLGVVKVTGADRADFLHRFVTNQVKELKTGDVRRAFLLTRAGRIAADMMIIAQEGQHLLVLDRCDAQSLVDQLDKFLFAEDVQLANVSDRHRVITVHGPQAAMLLNALGAKDLHTLEPLRAAATPLADKPAMVYRHDLTGAMGLHAVVELEHAPAIYQALITAMEGLTPEVQGGVKRSVTARGIGWMALNTARIEAGSSLYHIDFGPDSLPHEAGCLPHAVSFTKGCYLGQEIVARMQSLGHPKKLIVGLSFKDDRLPLAGAQVFDEDGATLIGGVTSSCLSPLKGNTAIALAMMKWAKHNEGTNVVVTAEGAQVPAVVKKLEV